VNRPGSLVYASNRFNISGDDGGNGDGGIFSDTSSGNTMVYKCDSAHRGSVTSMTSTFSKNFMSSDVGVTNHSSYSNLKAEALESGGGAPVH
jgi:hypothetical protein